MRDKANPKSSRRSRGFFSGNPRLVGRLRLSFWIGTLLALFAIGIQSYTSNKAQQLADQSYGIWETGVFQISSEQAEKILENPMIETIGTQSLAGQVVCPQPDSSAKQETADNEPDESASFTGYQSYGTIGYADDAFFELACLRLKYGDLPMQAGEIAVEAEALDSLGISYELGQPIELLVQTEEGSVEKQSFQLCGVLENYSRFWNGDGSTLRFFCASLENGGPFKSTPVENVFFKAKPGYSKVWKTLDIEREHIYLNDNREVSKDPLSAENLPFTTLMAGMVFIFFLFLVESMALWIYQHRHEIRLMRVFGIRKSRLCLDLLTLCAKAAWLPCLVLLLSLWLIKAPVWISQLLVVLSLLFCPCGLGILAIYTGSVCQYQPKPAASRIRHSRRLKNQPISEKIVRQRMACYLASNRLTMIGIILAIQVIWIFGVGVLANELIALNNLNSFPDYSIRSVLVPEKRFFLEETETHPAISSLFQYQEPIPQEMKDQILKNGNLENVYYYGWTMNNEVAWPDLGQSLIYSAQPSDFGMPDVPGTLSLNSRGQWRFYPRIYYYSQPEMVQSLQEQFFEGTVNWENWLQGKEAILSLPPVHETQPGVLNAVQDGADQGKTETTIKPGTILQITNRKGKTEQIPVSGIIRQPKESVIPLELPAYSIHLAVPLLNVVNADLKSQENQLSVELELSRLGSADGIEFRNYASEHMVNLQKLKMRILVIVCLCIAALTTGVFILILNENKLREKETDYLHRLKLAGLNKKKIDALVRSLHRKLYLFLFSTFMAILLMTVLLICVTSASHIHERVNVLLWAIGILGILVAFFLWGIRKNTLHPD